MKCMHRNMQLQSITPVTQQCTHDKIGLSLHWHIHNKIFITYTLVSSSNLLYIIIGYHRIDLIYLPPCNVLPYRREKNTYYSKTSIQNYKHAIAIHTTKQLTKVYPTNLIDLDIAELSITMTTYTIAERGRNVIPH